METSFPPRPIPGGRVWSGFGYQDHGPMEGPKVNIDPRMGGVISGAVQPYSTMDFLLYTVRWDNGQVSKHYFKGLFCIGRFSDPGEFESAIDLLEAKLIVGPYGGFRGAEIKLRYDGVYQEAELYKSDEYLWRGILEKIAERRGIEVETVKLPVAKRKMDASRSRPSSSR